MRGCAHVVGSADKAGAGNRPAGRDNQLGAAEDAVAGAAGNGLVDILAGVGTAEAGILVGVQCCIPGDEREEEEVAGNLHGEEGGNCHKQKRGSHGEEGGNFHEKSDFQTEEEEGSFHGKRDFQTEEEGSFHGKEGSGFLEVEGGLPQEEGYPDVHHRVGCWSSALLRSLLRSRYHPERKS